MTPVELGAFGLCMLFSFVFIKRDSMFKAKDPLWLCHNRNKHQWGEIYHSSSSNPRSSGRACRKCRVCGTIEIVNDYGEWVLAKVTTSKELK